MIIIELITYKYLFLNTFITSGVSKIPVSTLNTEYTKNFLKLIYNVMVKDVS